MGPRSRQDRGSHGFETRHGRPVWVLSPSGSCPAVFVQQETGMSKQEKLAWAQETPPGVGKVLDPVRGRVVDQRERDIMWALRDRRDVSLDHKIGRAVTKAKKANRADEDNE